MAEDLRTLTFFFIAPLYDLRPNLPRVQTSVKRRGRNPYRDTPTSSPGVRGRQEPLFARLIGILTFSKLSCSSSCIYSVGSVHPTRYHPPLNPRCAYICASLLAPLILFILPPPLPCSPLIFLSLSSSRGGQRRRGNEKNRRRGRRVGRLCCLRDCFNSACCILLSNNIAAEISGGDK